MAEQSDPPIDPEDDDSSHTLRFDGSNPAHAFTPKTDPPLVPPTPRSEPTPAQGSAPISDTGKQATVLGLKRVGGIDPGTILFDKYVVEEQIGDGGMGVVYKCMHKTLGKARAVKLIKPQLEFDEKSRQDFRAEARIMAALDHPNAVTIHDAQIGSDIAYIEMELLEGQSIEKTLKAASHKPMPLGWVSRILLQLCELLSEVHKRNIIHLDLKPSNLFLVANREEGDEFLKVLDFGIAKNLGGEQGSGKQEDGPQGTLAYASPEQVGGGFELDPRSDIYSVGVILYEFLTGRLPFSGPSLRYKTLVEPPPSFKTACKECTVPAEVEQVVLSCLAKNPADRPQTVEELWTRFFAAVPKPWKPGKVFYGVIGALVMIAVGVPLRLMLIPKTQVEAVDPNMPPAWMIPAGYEYVKGSGLVDGFPSVIKRKNSDIRFHFMPDGMINMGVDEFDVAYKNRGTEPNDEIADTPDQNDDRPRFKVMVTRFYLQETEVSNEEIKLFMKDQKPEDKQQWAASCDPDAFPDRKNRPAVEISKALAQAFAKSVGGDLPTEVQWEYAARGCQETSRPYVWGSPLPPYEKDESANLRNRFGTDLIRDCLWDVTNSGKMDETAQGIKGMMGNVREWCRDVWAPYPETTQVERDYVKLTPADDAASVVRGGSVRSFQNRSQTTWPRRLIPEFDKESLDELKKNRAAKDIGFRIVLPFPDQK